MNEVNRRSLFIYMAAALATLIPASAWAFFGKFGASGSKKKGGGP